MEFNLVIIRHMAQGINQKITVGTAKPQLEKRALACPNVAGDWGSVLSPPFPPAEPLGDWNP